MNKTETEAIKKLINVIDLLIKGNLKQPIDEIDTLGNEELGLLKDKILFLRGQYEEAFHYIMNLSYGNLDVEGPRHNTFASHYKQLQSELLHLKWLINEVAEGDYKQQMFLEGDLSKAFDKMIGALQEKQSLEIQLKETTEKLKALNMMKDRLFSIIAHDLINPFNALVGYSSLLQESARQCCKEDLKEMTSIMNQSARNGYDLLVNLLEWSRQQSGRITVTSEFFSLEEIIQSNIETARLAALSKKITLQASGAEGIQVYTDGALLHTVIRNLISNAIKYTPEGGKVSVHVIPKESFLQISIKDNGVGIPEECKQKLFKTDTVYSTKGTSNESGTGLGLILCQEFIHMLQGKIWVESTVGVGSIFSFTLPDVKNYYATQNDADSSTASDM